MSTTELGKRRRSDSEYSERACKIQRVYDPQTEHLQQFPSSFSARRASFEDHITFLDNPAANQKRKAESLDTDRRPRKRPWEPSQTNEHTSSVDEWLSNVPETFENMSQPSSKRSRSSDTLGRRLSYSSDETETTVSRDAKYSAYKDVNYTVVLETKNSYMRVSPTGLFDEDRKLCDRFLHEDQLILQNSMFDDNRFEEFCSHLQGRSEARVYLDLHPLLVPSAENLFICGQRNLEYLIDGYNDCWVKTIPFYGSRPQPDHTVGFKWSAFTELQRRKLGIDPTSKSYYTAREDIYFPFLTTEVKCGKIGLDLADRANTNSMTTAIRGVVELFRKVGRPMDIHRRALTFSISHDHSNIRLYAHYPEIDGDKTSFWRYTIEQFFFQGGGGAKKWMCYAFTRNIYEKFVPIYLEMIKGAIDEIPDPAEASFESAIAVDKESAFSLQEIASSAPESQEGEFRKPRQTKGFNAELRTMIQGLQQQLEQQRKESEQQRKESEQQVKQRETTLMAQLEQQRKESEQQRKELMQLIQQQTEQLNQLLRRQ